MKTLSTSLFFVLLLGSLIFSSCTTKHNTKQNQQQIYLSDSLWYIHTPEGKTWQVQVPGNSFIDLWKADEIDAPFAKDNEIVNKHLEENNYRYSCHFTLPNSYLQKDFHQLVIEGLDTYAQVKLNGKTILVSKNMFRPYTIEVKKLLKRYNHLEILFQSATRAADSLFEAYPLPLPADNDRNAKATSVFTRKAPYQYGWDWGPRYVGQGIWLPIYLKSGEDINVKTHRLWQKKLVGTHTATVGLQLDFTAQNTENIDITLRINDSLCYSKTLAIKAGTHSFTDSCTLPNVQLWFPNGMGNPKLYHFDIEIHKKDRLLWRTTQNLGFRNIVLQRKIDSIGKSFTFEVNGTTLYAKGANYIPQNVFPSQVKASHYRRLLQQAKDAHFNMIRVWGGGIYEKDIFYQLCDSLGLMVWQDFMFACSLYPTDSTFIQEVQAEAQSQILRLRDHACLALWCGNNEINELWHNWGYQKKYGYSPVDSAWLWHNYQSLFQELLPQMVKTYDSRTCYLESSPVFGWGHKESMTHGDSHYWGIWWGKQDFEMYTQKVPRFSSEFGFQSLPALNTLLSFTDSSQLGLDSPHLKAHQKSSIGSETIMDYILRYFAKPNNFTSLIYTSQLTQAYGLHMAFAAQRSAKPYCMGTLFWQLNDCWPGLSWSAIDYYGQQKALYYTAKRDFKTFMLCEKEDKNTLVISAISDSTKPVDVDLECYVIQLNGDTVYRYYNSINIEKNSSKTVAHVPLGKWDKKTHYIYSKLSLDKRVLADNYHFLCRPKTLALSKTSISVLPSSVPNQFVIENPGNSFAYGIYLSTATKGNFSDNFFHLPAGYKKIILFAPLQTQKNIDVKSIKIESLNPQ